MDRVALISNRSFAIERSRVPLIRTLQDMKCGVDVLTADATEVGTALDLGVMWKDVGLVRNASSPVSDLRAIVQIRRHLAERGIRLVHAFNAKPVILSAMAIRSRIGESSELIATITGLGASVDAGGVSGRLANVGYRIAGHTARWTVFQNPEDLDAFVSRGWVPRERSMMIPGSGVDTDRFRPGRPEQEMRTARPLRILMVSRLLRSKGVHEFCEAAFLARERGIEAEWTLAGETEAGHVDGMTEIEVRTLACRCGVKFCGYLHEIDRELPEYDVLVNPSRYREGLPRVVLEAASCGLAVIGSDIPGTRLVIESGRTGRLVPPRDVLAIVEAVESLAMDPDERVRMGRQARARIVETYAIEPIRRRYQELYTRVLRSGRATWGEAA